METYRFYPEGVVYFVTFSVVDWLPVFVSDAPCKIVTESFEYCRIHKGLCGNAYVIMPSHLHAILFHKNLDPGKLESAVMDFRKFTGRRLCDYCEEHMPNPYKTSFRASAGNDRERRFWQASRHAEQIESEAFWRSKVEYIHDNPCRKGLVLYPEYWRFSSAADWSGCREFESDLEISELIW
jgi:REP element-mobilizing transposase RayT